MKIYPYNKLKNIISTLLLNYEYLGTSDTNELAFKEIETGSFFILSFSSEYLYCQKYNNG